jgi:hypothetical protein
MRLIAGVNLWVAENFVPSKAPTACPLMHLIKDQILGTEMEFLRIEQNMKRLIDAFKMPELSIKSAQNRW